MFSLKAEAAAEALQNTTEGTSIKRFKHNNEETHADTDYTALAIRVANIEASDTQHRCRLDASAQRIKAVATGVEIAHHNTKSTSSGSSSNVATFSSEMSTPSKSSTCVNKSSLSRAGRSIRSGKVERQLAAAAEELRLRSMPNEFIGADGLRHVPPAVRTLMTTCNARWAGRRLVDVCLGDFSLVWGADPALWCARIASGLVKVEPSGKTTQHKQSNEAENDGTTHALHSATAAATLFLRSHISSSPSSSSDAAATANASEDVDVEALDPADLGNHLLAHFERALTCDETSQVDSIMRSESNNLSNISSSHDATKVSVVQERATKAIRAGRVLGDALNPILRAGDKVSHTLHWHEPPVSGCHDGLSITQHCYFSQALRQASARNGISRRRCADDEEYAGIEKGDKRNIMAVGTGHIGGLNEDGVDDDDYDDGDDDDDDDDDDVLYAISKPATVPSHAGGVYLASSLLTMAEAQLGFPPRSLGLCHRLDRLTSGLVLAARIRGKAARTASALFASKIPQPMALGISTSGQNDCSTGTSSTLRGSSEAHNALADVKHDEESEWVLRKSYLVLVKGFFPGSASALAARFGSISSCSSNGDRDGDDWSDTIEKTLSSNTLQEDMANESQNERSKLMSWIKRSQPISSVTAGTSSGDTRNMPGDKGAFSSSNSSSSSRGDSLAVTVSWTPLNQPWTAVEWVSTDLTNGFASVRSTVGLVDVESNRYGPIAPGDATTDGKLSHSLFSLIRYNREDDTSLLWARPVTGRTHQLRVHLATVLGYPVVNDTLYSDSLDENSGNDRSNGTGSGSTTCNSSNSDAVPKGCKDSSSCKNVCISGSAQAHASPSTLPASPSNPARLCAALCVYCQHGPAEAFSKEQLRSHGICLHALRLDVHRRYTCSFRSFSSVPPSMSGGKTDSDVVADNAGVGLAVPGAAPASIHLLPLLIEACGAFPPPLPIGGAYSNEIGSPYSNNIRDKKVQDRAADGNKDVIVAISVPPPNWAL